MRERDIEKYLVERVKALGGEVRKVKWIGRNGAPDRLVMLPPLVTVKSPKHRPTWNDASPAQTIWVELKATGKKPEPHQLREHARLKRMGQRVEVIDSIEGVDGLLR